ncbi:hypothetical protein HY379_00210 [Candidatus Saccharibacteria bacterium]|nr:hypothetical protein [Candidatus Saccharibacteria bacterium]
MRAYHYRSGGAAKKSPFQRRPKAKTRGFVGKTLDWLVIVAILAAAAYSLILSPQPTTVLNSTVYRTKDAYNDAAITILKQLKNRNKLTFDENSLEAALKRQFPEVSSAAVDLPLFGRSPTVRITIAKPSLILKGAEGTVGDGQRLIIDSKGTVIGPVSDFPAIQDLPLITDETGYEARVGRSALSLSDVNFILTVIAQANNAKVPIASLILPTLAQEVDLRTTDRGYFVKFYLAGDALVQSGQFLAARKNFEQTKKDPAQYLDVRVFGKVFYK